ncbi:MAG TPA: prephenate dehydrogenase/arogenate dehydrogenase family protein [Thermoanaerobaculia bacterium]|nr:prephenate dehydrogenase/arogenate dehydrogenase family protein [Thermoanaerobaculia bacterium]
MTREAIVVGLGLIGGSIAKALRADGWAVRYDDPHAETSDFARAEDWNADVIVLATPVDAAVAWLRDHDAQRVTSVCSVMRPLRDAARGHFIAGHPLAGSEQRGYAASRGDLFRGKRWFVDADDEVMDAMIAACGAIRERVAADEHDAALALTSHIPQVLSTALAAYLAEQNVDLKFAGTGLATFLRLADSDASVWTPVLDANRDNIAPHIDAITRIARQLDENAFHAAQKLAQQLKS